MYSDKTKSNRVNKRDISSESRIKKKERKGQTAIQSNNKKEIERSFHNFATFEGYLSTTYNTGKLLRPMKMNNYPQIEALDFLCIFYPVDESKNHESIAYSFHR